MLVDLNKAPHWKEIIPEQEFVKVLSDSLFQGFCCDFKPNGRKVARDAAELSITVNLLESRLVNHAVGSLPVDIYLKFP